MSSHVANAAGPARLVRDHLGASCRPLACGVYVLFLLVTFVRPQNHLAFFGPIWSACTASLPPGSAQLFGSVGRSGPRGVPATKASTCWRAVGGFLPKVCHILKTGDLQKRDFISLSRRCGGNAEGLHLTGVPYQAREGRWASEKPVTGYEPEARLAGSVPCRTRRSPSHWCVRVPAWGDLQCRRVAARTAPAPEQSDTSRIRLAAKDVLPGVNAAGLPGSSGRRPRHPQRPITSSQKFQQKTDTPVARQWPAA